AVRPGGRREHDPHHDAARGDADIDAELGDRAGVVLDRPRCRRREGAADVALRTDDQADAGRHVAGELAGLDALLRLARAGNRGNQCCGEDEDARHETPSTPFDIAGTAVRARDPGVRGRTSAGYYSGGLGLSPKDWISRPNTAARARPVRWRGAENRPEFRL